jgi:hypothetical protein
MSSTHYRPSGRFSPLALVLLLLVVAVSLPLSWVYAWCAVHLPRFVMPFVTIGYFVLLLTGAISVRENGKVRSPVLMYVLAGVIGVAGWYFQWAQWGKMAGELTGAAWPGVLEVMLMPTGLMSAVVTMKGAGVWAVLSVTMEFLLLAVLPALIASSGAAQPFCETSKTWVSEIKLGHCYGTIAEADVKQFTAALAADPEQLMALLPELQGDPDTYSALSLYACEGNPEAYVSVWNVTRSVKDGKVREARTNLVEFLRISPDTARALVELDEQAAPAAGPADPEELKTALQALHEEHFEAALAAAIPHCGADNDALRNDANRICAIACARLARWAEASAYWETLFTREATSHNALQVASCSVMAGELAKGEQWFARVLEVNAQTSDTPLINSYTNFISALDMSGQHRAALPYLEWVRDIYQHLHITDATFLTLRGVPFFGSFLDKSAPIVAASMDASQARSWYAAMLAHIDQDGQDELNAWMAQRGYA